MRAAIYARYSAGPRQTDQSIEGGVLATSRTAFSNEVFDFIDKCSTTYRQSRAPESKLMLSMHGVLLVAKLKDEL